MWSGPSRALTEHIGMFRRATIAQRFVDQNRGRAIAPVSFPLHILQRLKLLSSSSGAKMQLLIEGHTVGVERDRPHEMFSEHNIAKTVGLIKMEYDLLNAGETHYVSHHVMTAIEAAAASADDEPIFPTDPPSPSGLIVFEYPMLIPDIHPDKLEVVPELLMPIRAIGWQIRDAIGVANPETGQYEMRPGIAYVTYTDTDTFNSIYAAKANELFGERGWKEGDDLSTELKMWPTDFSAWAFGAAWKTSKDLVPVAMASDGAVSPHVGSVRRWLLAHWRWMWQRITVGATYRPSKPELKRAVRAGLPEDGHIKVLRLRREIEMETRGEAGEPGFGRLHQWIVRGHWRRQWFRSLGPARHEDGSFNHDSHRLIWIEPHLAGNPFGPLVTGHNVTSSVR